MVPADRLDEFGADKILACGSSGCDYEHGHEQELTSSKSKIGNHKSAI